MKFGRMLKYDLRYGTVRRFGYYLLPLLLGVADAVRQVLNYYKVRNPGTLLDHWLIMTAGTQPYQPNTLHSYNFPTIWLIMQAFMLLVVNGYTSGDLEEHGSVMIVKSRSRAGWWLSKCVWCMFSTLLAYVIYYIPMFLIFAWRGIPMKNASDQASRHHVGGRILKLEDGRCVCRGSVYSGCCDDVSVSVTDAVRSSLVAGSGNHTVVGDTGNFGV